jgi:hypothetical protein
MCGRCRQQGHTANECPAPNPRFPLLERDWNKAEQVQFQEDKDVAKTINHITKDMSYFVTRFGKKAQNIMENETSNLEVEIQVEPPRITKDNLPVFILALIVNMESPVTQLLDTIPKSAENIQFIASSILPSKSINSMMKNVSKTIPNKWKQTCTMRLAIGMQPYVN